MLTLKRKEVASFLHQTQNLTAPGLLGEGRQLEPCRLTYFCSKHWSPAAGAASPGICRRVFCVAETRLTGASTPYHWERACPEFPHLVRATCSFSWASSSHFLVEGATFEINASMSCEHKASIIFAVNVINFPIQLTATPPAYEKLPFFSRFAWTRAF